MWKSLEYHTSKTNTETQMFKYMLQFPLLNKGTYLCEALRRNPSKTYK